MGDYGSVKIPRTTKATIKLLFFRLVDMMIVAGLFFGGYYLQEAIHLPGKQYLVFQLLNISFGIFCCLPSQHSPNKRTIQIVIHLLRRDTTKYFAGNYHERGPFNG